MPRREPHHRNVGPRDESDIHWRTLARFGVAKDSDIVRALMNHKTLRARDQDTMESPAIKKLATWAARAQQELDRRVGACEGDKAAEQFLGQRADLVEDVRGSLYVLVLMATGGHLRDLVRPRLRGKTVLRYWLLRHARGRMRGHTDGNIEAVVAALEFEELPATKKTRDTWEALREEIHQRHMDLLKPDRQKERHRKKQYAKDSD